MNIWPNLFMTKALEQARISFENNEVPVGAVIIDWHQQEILAITGNLCVANQDPTAHAEMLAIKQASLLKNNAQLSMCDIFVTLEPCPMCASAIAFARIRRLYFGAYDKKSGGVENGPRIFLSSAIHHVPEIYGGIYESQSSKLMQDFFQAKRKN